MSFNAQEAQARNFVTPIVPAASKARVEIEEFIGDNEMTNLYLLALEALQKEDANKSVVKKNEDWWTFYSLSGIHGQPAENWNGIQQPDGDIGGYCTHGQVVFPTWHRVYMNMFEQSLSNKIATIAAQFTQEPQKSLYKQAAARFRIPFWDPVLPRNKATNEKMWGLPKILSVTDVWVLRPNSTELTSIPNPLYALKFQNSALKAKGRTPIAWASNWGISTPGKEHTVRTPGRNGETSVANLELGIQRQTVSISTNLWKLLSRYTNDGQHNNELRTWSSFSTHNVIDPRTDKPIIQGGDVVYQNDTAVSLESWHDNIHGLVGTGQNFAGHMGNPAIAAFDPIFWLHHCNIDRILAIYQALYPDKWPRATDASANLYPFQKDTSKFWTSNDVKDWTTLGYAIPGNKPLDAKGRNALETHLYEYYNWTTSGTNPPKSVSDNWPRDLSTSIALYGKNAKKVTTPVVKFEALEASQLLVRTVAVQTPQAISVTVEDAPKTIKVHNAAADTAANPPETIKDKSVLTWNARIRVKKFAYNGSFNIHLFIGSIPDDEPTKFITKKNEVGFSHIFATSTDSPCANCTTQRADGLLYEDVIPISHSLKHYLRSNTAAAADGPIPQLRVLDNYEPENVVPFLAKNLQWRITDTAGNLLGDEQKMRESGLVVAVSCRLFDLPTPEMPLGVYHPAKDYAEITE
ncbi:hypothetical protein HYALB_00013118, partial [Hymenoscyphus albidus]